jgi:sugar phosphate isomerase/epimerase
MKELAIAIRNYNKDNYKEIIDNIKKAGFKNVFIEWYNNDKVLQNEIYEYVKKLDLNIIFAHLGYQNPNALWEDSIDGDIELDRYINDIRVCKNNGIEMVIIHPTCDFDKPIMSEIGLNRIRKIIECAEENNMKVAFENVELGGYLEYILKNIDSNNLGICFDAGHCHLFYDDKFNTEFFKDKVFMIHLHDNFKEYDDHNLPFDGNVNWEEMVKMIINMNYDNKYIVIESGYKKYYSNITLEEYYTVAYNRGLKLIELFNKFEENNK